MKLEINLLLLIIIFLISDVYLKRSVIYTNRRWTNNQFNNNNNNFITPSSVQLNNFGDSEQNQLVKQLINELTNNLNNKTLVNRIRLNLKEKKNDQQLVSNLTGNLANKDPLMSDYLDEKLKTYLIKIQQQSINQKIDLMDILRQFNDIITISKFNLTNDEFELIDKINRTESSERQDDFELIYTPKNSTDLNSTKLSRMEFLTDTLISLLIGKLIGLKIGFFAGKLISSVPFSIGKRTCCNTNTWPSDSPMGPTEASNIIRNQFISMKTDKKSTNEKKSKNKNKKPINNDDWLENEEDWKNVDENDDNDNDDDKEDQQIKRNGNKSNNELNYKIITKTPSSLRTKNKFSINDAFESSQTYDQKLEDSLDLDELPSSNKVLFKQYTNYHPIYSTTIYKDNQYTTISSLITNLPNIQTTTLRNHKQYMLLTGK